MKIVPTRPKLKEKVKELTHRYAIAKNISESNFKEKQDLKNTLQF